MARGSDIRYVQFYTDGSAARQLEIAPRPKKKPQQRRRPRKQKRIVLQVDFVALAGVLVAGVMLILMLSGMASLGRINKEITRLETVLSDLETKNLELHQKYRAGFDLDQIREEALEMGMIPASRAMTVSLPVGTGE